jgi:Fe-S-cluster-containing hydrogenase component 2
MIARCPQQAISQEGFNLPTIDPHKCVACMYCVMNCPMQAFEKV